MDSLWDEVNGRYSEPYRSDAVCDYLGELDERLDEVIDRQVKALAVLEIATLRALSEVGLSAKDHLATRQTIYHLKIFTHQLEVLESFVRRHLYELTELPDPSTVNVHQDLIDYYRRRADFVRDSRELARPFLTDGPDPFDFDDWEVGGP